MRRINQVTKTPRLASFRSLMVFWLGGLCLWGMGVANGSTTSYSDAIRVLKKEQSQAESYMALLNTMGKENTQLYGQGIMLYADAKAEFDGLIEKMQSDLKSGKEPAASSEFDALLKTAVDRRVAFTSFISKQVVGKTSEGIKFPWLATAGELLPELVDAAKYIWEEYRNSKQSRRQEILDELEGLKWKPFHEIPGSQ